MNRTLIIFIALAIAWILGRKYLAELRKKGDQQTSKTTSVTQTTHTMVQCAFCGIYIPKLEAVVFEQQFFCCEAHKRAALTPR